MIRRKANNKHFLDIFGLPDVSRRILLDIIHHGDSSVADIAGRLGIPKSTIYDSITPLLRESLVNEYSGHRGKMFGISDDEQLVRAHLEKMDEFKRAHTSLLSFIKNTHRSTGSTEPKIKFYAGVLGIKQAFRDMPWRKDVTETFMLWPTRDMIGIDEDFFKWHGTQRFKYRVFIYAVEKHEDRALQRGTKHEWLKNDARDNLVSVRYLPKGVDCKMSFWLYGDKCLFASGGTERIAFTVHSREFCAMMKLLWQSMWDVAKK